MVYWLVLFWFSLLTFNFCYQEKMYKADLNDTLGPTRQLSALDCQTRLLPRYLIDPDAGCPRRVQKSDTDTYLITVHVA